MKVIKSEVLISTGDFADSTVYADIKQEIEHAISKVVWPSGYDQFIIHPKRKGNGVKPIKRAFQEHLRKHGWVLEHRVDVGVTLRQAGPIDATKVVEDRFFAVEWETGNISSSHRALNKIVVGMLHGVLAGGALVLPTRNLYRYLTDRIGNFQELAPYFPVWRAVKCDQGFLVVFAIEYDAVSKDVPLITKGTDGRALV